MVDLVLCTTIVSLQGDQCKVITAIGDEKATIETINHNILTVVRLKDENFALRIKGANTILHLQADYQTSNGYNLSVAIQEFVGHILKINGDEIKLYVLSEVQKSTKLKVYEMQGGVFELIATIKDIDKRHPEFSTFFICANWMTKNCLIISDQ